MAILSSERRKRCAIQLGLYQHMISIEILKPQIGGGGVFGPFHNEESLKDLD
jgi:hypothetical protein